MKTAKIKPARITIRRDADKISLMNDGGVVIAYLFDSQTEICHDPWADSPAIIMGRPLTDWPAAIALAGLDVDTIRQIAGAPDLSYPD